MNRLLIGLLMVCVSSTLLPAEYGKVSEINQLRAENAMLKKRVASLKKQLAQIKKPATKTTPAIEKKVEAPNPKMGAFWAAYDEWRKQRLQSLRFLLSHPRNWSIETTRTFRQEFRAAQRVSKLYIAPRFEGEICLGQLAKVYNVTVFQISDANNMLAELLVRDYTGVGVVGSTEVIFHSEKKKVLVWVKGIDTTRLADRGKAKINKPMAITGTRTYSTEFGGKSTVLGGQSTVFVLEPFDSLPPRPMRGKR